MSTGQFPAAKSLSPGLPAPPTTLAPPLSPFFSDGSRRPHDASLPAFFSSPRGNLLPSLSSALAQTYPVPSYHFVPSYSPREGLTASAWGSITG